MEENGRYDVSVPQSRIELLLHQMIKNGGGIGPTPGGDIATDEDIQGITDEIWPDEP